MSKANGPHEMLVLWTDLTDALRTSYGRTAIVKIRPWECSDEKVKQAWEKVTHPDNLKELDRPFEVESTEALRLWHSKALEECKRRAQKRDR